MLNLNKLETYQATMLLFISESSATCTHWYNMLSFLPNFKWFDLSFILIQNVQYINFPCWSKACIGLCREEISDNKKIMWDTHF